MVSKKAFEVKYYKQGDIYNHYKERGGKLTQGEFGRICRLFNAKVYDKMIKDGFDFRIPYKLGNLGIMSFKPKIKVEDGKIVRNNFPIDWRRTRELWKEMYTEEQMKDLKNVKNKPLVYYENDHSDGYRMIVRWDRSMVSMKGVGLYGFYPAKGGLYKGLYYGRRGLSRWLLYNRDSDSKIYTKFKDYGV